MEMHPFIAQLSGDVWPDFGQHGCAGAAGAAAMPAQAREADRNTNMSKRTGSFLGLLAIVFAAVAITL